MTCRKRKTKTRKIVRKITKPIRSVFGDARTNLKNLTTPISNAVGKPLRKGVYGK